MRARAHTHTEATHMFHGSTQGHGFCIGDLWCKCARMCVCEPTSTWWLSLGLLRAATVLSFHSSGGWCASARCRLEWLLQTKRPSFSFSFFACFFAFNSHMITLKIFLALCPMEHNPPSVPITSCSCPTFQIALTWPLFIFNASFFIQPPSFIFHNLLFFFFFLTDHVHNPLPLHELLPYVAFNGNPDSFLFWLLLTTPLIIHL